MNQDNDQDWKRITAAFFTAQDSKAPPYFSARVMAHIRALAQKRQVRIPFWKWVTPLVGLLMVNVYLVLNDLGSKPTEVDSIASITGGREDHISEWLATSTPVDDLSGNELGWEEI
jgi:hypothetical protein